ncbi:hypothetical protein MVEN_00820100 [Mycena venus]|uniref:Uncharacterized protein n=1 Tax=Mycena venus TaxID=2733690 RepID=A0A8H6YFS7_9AGAR|nr:hypothetical protein MVEN_00820100 [Mycena venus]
MKTTQDDKAKGTALFSAGEYLCATQEFSNAIKSPVGKNLKERCPVFQSSRMLLCFGYAEGLTDSEKATELDPTNSKAWIRRGACGDGLGRYNESIQSYAQAMSSTSIPTLLRKCEDALKTAKAKLPTPPPNTKKPTTQDQKSNKLQLLLIPESQTAPLTHHEFTLDPDTSSKIASLLECSLTDSVVLHSEDQSAYIRFCQGCGAKKKPNGVGIGNFHISYEA